MEFNKYQTPIDELTYRKVDEEKQTSVLVKFKDAPQEVQDEFYEHLSTIPFIQHLVSANRPYVKDLERDEQGRAMWDIERPPLVEDIDYFRPTARHYQQYGTLTDLRPNPNPNSEYSKWKNEEVRRIREGFLRTSDGMYITGDMYWYLNYTPIIITKALGDSGTGYRDVDFPDFWEGIWWRFTGWSLAQSLGLQFAEIAKRGAGKSYSVASKLSKVFVIGNKRTEEERRKKMNSRAVVMAYQKEFLTKDGTLNKFEDMIDFLAENTEFPRKTLKRSLGEMDWIMGYVDLNTGAKKGTGNEVLGVAVKDDPDKGRGKRAEFVCFEEFGKFPNVASVLEIAMPSVKDGDLVFGLIVLIGTGGEEGNDFSGALDMIYHPAGSHLLGFENVWDKSAQTRGKSIFFFPAYINRKGCYNKDGISDVTKALYALCYERYIAKYENPDPMKLTRTKAENPITLQDAIMRRDGTKFPVAQITERIQEIDLNPNFFDDILSGRFYQAGNGEVKFEPTGDKPIHKFPHKDNKVAGAIEIYKMPEKNRDNKVFSGRYIAGLDPVDDDSSTTMSLVSLFVMDLWTDSIVCEWTGRLDNVDDCYEIVRLTCLFYNAKLNYENNKKGLYAYFKKMNCLYLLEETLEFLKDKQNMQSDLRGNKMYGVNANAFVNEYARTKLKDWLLLPIKTQTEDGEESTTLKVMTMWNRALLEELRQWNPDGNFDRVSAMGMLMLMREDKLIMYGGHIKQNYNQGTTKDISDDAYFEKNYKPRKFSFNSGNLAKF